MNSRRRLKMTSSIVKPIHLLLFLFIVLTLGGCASKPKPIQVDPAQLQSYLSDKPAALHSTYAKVLKEGKRNQVLNLVDAAIAAIRIGEYKLAAHTLDQALTDIEAVYANNETATQARSLWYEEGGKDFKGEPYERVMTYYYRGLLYMIEGDYENARACFKTGTIQDAFAEESQYQCDFALMYFLEGWCSQLLGDMQLATEAYAEVSKLRPDFVPPSPQDNLLAVIETGSSPRKVADGVGHAELKYRRGKNIQEHRAWLSVNGQLARAYPIEDIFYQAATRGGRGIDKILEGQAVFLKQGMDIGTTLTDISSTTILASTLLNSSGNMAEVGAVIGGVGGIVTLVAINAKPHADTRYLHNLPDMVHIFSTSIPQATPIDVSFSGGDDQQSILYTAPTTPIEDPKGNYLLWSKSK